MIHPMSGMKKKEIVPREGPGNYESVLEKRIWYFSFSTIAKYEKETRSQNYSGVDSWHLISSHLLLGIYRMNIFNPRR